MTVLSWELYYIITNTLYNTHPILDEEIEAQTGWEFPKIM